MKAFIRTIIVLLAMTVISSYPSAAQQEVDVKGLEKEVKRLKKEGYKPLPGYPSLEEQLVMQQISFYNYDAERVPKYIMGSSRCEITECGLESAVQKATNQVINEIALMVAEEILAACAESKK